MVTYEIFPAQHLILVRLSNEVRYDDISAIFVQVMEDPHFSPDFCGVVDMRKANLRISPEEIERLGSIAAELAISRGRWAYLADSPLSTALAMLYREQLVETHDSAIFSTPEAAGDYVGADLSFCLTS